MAQSWNGWCYQLGLASSLAISGALACFGEYAFAQITPDTTLGNESSVVTPLDPGLPVDLIDGGAIRGANLFHSFREFNVAARRGAYFFSPNAGIQNIIARVTGSNSSEILGTIGTFGNSIPNLFLINPNGIIFGPDASLDMGNAGLNVGGSGGSFVATTANAVLLGDRGRFSASEPAASNLLTVRPSALFFNSVSRSKIVNRSTATNSVLGLPVSGLLVPNGRSLLLVGGDVSVDGGRLTASGGRVELGGVAGTGTVGLNVDGNNLRLSFPDEVARADVSLSNRAVVNASGEGGGDIHLQGRRITLTDASDLFADTLGSQDGRGISIQALELIVRDGAQISTSTSGTGQAGTLSVTAEDSVQLSGTVTTSGGTFPSGLFVRTQDTGSAGALTITTGQLIVRDGANVSTSTSGKGRGGTLTVTAEDSVELSGTSPDNQSRSGLFAATEGSGDAGNLTITTGQLIVQNGAQVSAGTSDGSTGQGGTLTVTAEDSVELSGTSADRRDASGLFARTRGTGDAGNLTIATGQLIVRDGAQVNVSGVNSGDAGNLEVKVRDLLLDNQGAIVAETASGEGGNITLQAQDLLLMRNNSRISTTAGTAQAGGDGGNIIIDTPFIVAVPQENSDIAANAFEGKGGFIQITAQGIFGLERRSVLTPLSDITAFSQQNPELNGVVEINTPDIDPSRGLVNLPPQPTDTSVAQACQPGGSQEQSEFVITGRGGLPPNPKEALSSDAIQVDWVTLNPGVEDSSSPTVFTQPTAPEPAPIVEAQGWVIGPNGEVVLTASSVPVLPHSSWQTKANCHGS